MLKGTSRRDNGTAPVVQNKKDKRKRNCYILRRIKSGWRKALLIMVHFLPLYDKAIIGNKCMFQVLDIA